MTLQAHPFKRIFNRFFHKKYTPSQPQEQEAWASMDPQQKKELALQYLAQGEFALLQGNLQAILCFEAAARLDGENPQIWYRQGLAFFEYGSEEGNEKFLLLASKHFKYALEIFHDFFDAWIAWGNTLLQLGRFHEEHHFLLEAKEKYQKALELSGNQPKGVLAELHWDYGIVWAELAKYSGEALDLRFAIDAFRTSLQLQDNPPPEFLNDLGSAYLEMGLLVNDSRIYLQAILYLQSAVETAPNYFDGWTSLAESYSQLYMNTLEERYLLKALEAYQNSARIDPSEPEVWLDWAQILGEAGKQKGDMKLLRQSMEKCARAAHLDAENPSIIAQWVESLSTLGSLGARLDLLIEAEQKVLKAVDDFPDDPEIWHAYGVCLMHLGTYYEDLDSYEMAIDKLQYSLSIDRSIAEHWHTLGALHKLYGERVYHADLFQRANRFFARAMDLKPSFPPLLFDAASSLLTLSKLTDDLSSLEQSLHLFETLLKQHKTVILQHPQWVFAYGSALAWLADFTDELAPLKKAYEIFSHVLLIAPDSPQIHYQLAKCATEMGHHAGEAEYYRRAVAFFRLAVRQEEENDQVWLDWGICLIYLAEHTIDPDISQQIYWDAEQKILRSGQLGNSFAYYNLACLYSLLGKEKEAMEMIHQALAMRALPPLEEILEDEWLENLRQTTPFTDFLNALEEKLQTREQ